MTAQVRTVEIISAYNAFGIFMADIRNEDGVEYHPVLDFKRSESSCDCDGGKGVICYHRAALLSVIAHKEVANHMVHVSIERLAGRNAYGIAQVLTSIAEVLTAACESLSSAIQHEDVTQQNQKVERFNLWKQLQAAGIALPVQGVVIEDGMVNELEAAYKAEGEAMVARKEAVQVETAYQRAKREGYTWCSHCGKIIKGDADESKWCGRC